MSGEILIPLKGGQTLTTSFECNEFVERVTQDDENAAQAAALKAVKRAGVQDQVDSFTKVEIRKKSILPWNSPVTTSRAYGDAPSVRFMDTAFRARQAKPTEIRAGVEYSESIPVSSLPDAPSARGGTRAGGPAKPAAKQPEEIDPSKVQRIEGEVVVSIDELPDAPKK